MALAPERLSRFLTFLLRHKPKEYPLSIDAEGFARWRDVMALVHERFYDVTEGQVRALIAGAEKNASSCAATSLAPPTVILSPSILPASRPSRRRNSTSVRRGISPNRCCAAVSNRATASTCT